MSRLNAEAAADVLAQAWGRAVPEADLERHGRGATSSDTVRAWLGCRGRRRRPSCRTSSRGCFLRLEEHERPQRDRWGCWDYEYSENFRSRRLWTAEVDRWVAERRAELAATSARAALAGRPCASPSCLTHDVDLISDRVDAARRASGTRGPGSARRAEDERAARAPRPACRRALRSRAGGSRAPSSARDARASVALEAERGLTASYLFTVPPRGARSRWDCVYAPGDRCRFRGERVGSPTSMRTLADEGFDVGLHGSYRAGARPGALAAERDALEPRPASRSTTTRQHFLHWDVRWTPRFQEEAGFRVDSSLGFNRNAGYRAGTSLPFRQFDVATRTPLGLLEVPLVVQDGALLGAIGLGARRSSRRASSPSVRRRRRPSSAAP